MHTTADEANSARPMRPLPRRLLMFALLRQRNFSLLWWGGLFSLTGNRVLSVALPFYVYQQTGSTVATATMVMATIVPSMLFSTIAGVLVDRWEGGKER